MLAVESSINYEASVCILIVSFCVAFMALIKCTGCIQLTWKIGSEGPLTTSRPDPYFVNDTDKTNSSLDFTTIMQGRFLPSVPVELPLRSSSKLGDCFTRHSSSSELYASVERRSVDECKNVGTTPNVIDNDDDLKTKLENIKFNREAVKTFVVAHPSQNAGNKRHIYTQINDSRCQDYYSRSCDIDQHDAVYSIMDHSDVKCENCSVNRHLNRKKPSRGRFRFELFDRIYSRKSIPLTSVHIDPLIYDSKRSSIEDPYSSIRTDENYSRLDDLPGPSTAIKHYCKKNNCESLPSKEDGEFYSSPLKKTRYSPSPFYSAIRRSLVRSQSDSTDYGTIAGPSKSHMKYSKCGGRGRMSGLNPSINMHNTIINEQNHDSGQDNDSSDSYYFNDRLPNKTPCKEPHYRYLTVREPLSVLLSRLTHNHQANGVQQTFRSNSEPSSLHYYSTISEHNYETVPYGVCYQTENQPWPSTSRQIDGSTHYIDEDLYCLPGPSSASSNRNPVTEGVISPDIVSCNVTRIKISGDEKLST